jgi:hypothetical protein
MSKEGFRCGHCGKWHEGLPKSWNFEAPVYWDYADKSLKSGDSELKDDLCVIKGEHFFIKGNIDIPVLDDNSTFTLSAWTSLSKANFQRATDLWSQPKRVEEPPYFGWLSSMVPGYPDTINLKSYVHSRAVGIKPLIELEPTEHPLALEQKAGISLARVAELAAFFLHSHH